MLVSQLTWKVVYGVLISFDLNLGVPCFELLGSLVSPLVEASQHTALLPLPALHILDYQLLVDYLMVFSSSWIDLILRAMICS